VWLLYPARIPNIGMQLVLPHWEEEFRNLTVFASLTSFDPKFARLSKFNPRHVKFFDLGGFDFFPRFPYFDSPFASQIQVKGRLYPALSLCPVG
jgi:hypothetical protein